MKITDIKVRKLIFDDKPVKAIVSITIDNALAVHDIKIVEVKNKVFVSFPETKIKEKFLCTVHPISTEARSEIEKEILTAYNEAYSEYVITHADC